MCDIYPGRLILCFPKLDVAGKQLVEKIQKQGIEHVSYIESMDDKFRKLDLAIDPEIEFDLHLVNVPPGQENWKITYLQFFWKIAFLEVLRQQTLSLEFLQTLGRSDFQFTVAPDHQLSLAHAASGGSAISAKNFQFGPLHQSYKKMMGYPRAAVAQLAPVQVLVLDSGLAADAQVTLVAQRNLVATNQPFTVPDDNGHGTAVTKLIHDMAPSAEFLIYKVADATGRVSEWDALAGMVAASGAHVVNMSIQFGLPDKAGGCAICGRESQASRSAIFENIVDQLTKRTPRPVLVAAAGNWGGNELGFPARFGHVLAIGAVTSKHELASDSNYGDRDETGSLHANHYVAPGGDPAKGEAAVTAQGKTYAGTSFGAAFASGLVADEIARLGVSNYGYDQLVASLRRNAD